MDWPYYTLNTNGTLQTDDGDYLVGEDGKTRLIFASADAAETYLEENDIRGNVRRDY